MASSSPWLPSAALTDAGRPVFLPGEVERHLVPSVDLEAEENPSLLHPPLRAGLLALTSHRLIWIHEPSSSARALPLSSIVHAFPPRSPSDPSSPPPPPHPPPNIPLRRLRRPQGRRRREIGGDHRRDEGEG
uniref:GLUE N-terminal domain-containing protein n=1 Tax=Ananas comosus var. bracteatus TaxID=296719 RepID=A0A6V7PG10_ANACO|nr:unnamed protein product [Ananas comosus var. bracteatus]